MGYLKQSTSTMNQMRYSMAAIIMIQALVAYIFWIYSIDIIYFTTGVLVIKMSAAIIKINIVSFQIANFWYTFRLSNFWYTFRLSNCWYTFRVWPMSNKNVLHQNIRLTKCLFVLCFPYLIYITK